MLDLDHLSGLMCVGEDVPEVLDMITTVLADSNHRIPQLHEPERISYKEEVAEDFSLDMLYPCIERLDFIVWEVLHELLQAANFVETGPYLF